MTTPSPARAAAASSATAAAGWVRDPVCREWIHTSIACAPPVAHHGETFHFCDGRCRAAFLAEPGRYLGALAGAPG